MLRATRSVATVARAARGYSTASGQEFLAQRAAVKAHAKGAFLQPAQDKTFRPCLLGSSRLGNNDRYCR
jgi:hypothetical protein